MPVTGGVYLLKHRCVLCLLKCTHPYVIHLLFIANITSLFIVSFTTGLSSDEVGSRRWYQDNINIKEQVLREYLRRTCSREPVTL